MMCHHLEPPDLYRAVVKIENDVLSELIMSLLIGHINGDILLFLLWRPIKSNFARHHPPIDTPLT